MKHDIHSYRILPFVSLCAWLCLSQAESFGYPTGSNNWHLNSSFQARANADLVCKVQVLSIRQDKVVKGNLFPGQQDLLSMKATSKVLSIIKGECPDVIDIELRRPANSNSTLGLLPGELYTDLSENEVCLVFLKLSGPNYKLNRIRSKARIRPEVVDYNLGETPNLKLLAEFLAGCDSENELVKLQAVEELGYLGDAMIRKLRFSKVDKELFQRTVSALGRAKEALRNMHSDEDIVIRNISVISSFQADDSPGIEGALELLRMNPSDFGPSDSLKKYGIRGFCVSSLQLRLLETMDATTRRVVVDLKDGSVIRRETGSPYPFRGVRGFDYAAFYRQALDCEAVRNNEQMRSAIANVLWIRYERRSIPEMIRLLDDSRMHIRSTAVSALRKCINSDRSNSWEPGDFYNPQTTDPSSSNIPEKPLEQRQKDYENNEQEYIQYWKNWWQEHKNEFEKPELVNMELIDTHCHLTFEQLAWEIDEVVQRSIAAGVTGWITVGTDPQQNRKAVELANRFENMYAAVGIHPHDAKDVAAGTMAELKELAGSEKVVAIGETGLDFHYDFSPRQDQRRVFEAQLEIARQLNLPVIIHCREAFDETIDILEQFIGIKGRLKSVVFHCFGGSARQAGIVLDHGFYISFTGVVTFKNAEQAREAAKIVPADKLMLETDCPYMSPAPMRKRKINEPALMVHTARFLAELKEMESADFARAVTAASKSFFGLP